MFLIPVEDLFECHYCGHTNSTKDKTCGLCRRKRPDKSGRHIPVKVQTIPRIVDSTPRIVPNKTMVNILRANKEGWTTIFQGLVTKVTTHGCHVADPKWDINQRKTAEWFPLDSPHVKTIITGARATEKDTL